MARRAGDLVMKFYQMQDIKAEIKEDASPVTEADLASHQLLLRELPRLVPDVPVISEESSSDKDAILKQVMSCPLFWLVDPLDGTRDFLGKSGDFTVNIALMVDGVPRIGCVFAPAKGRCFVADYRSGAFVQNSAGEALVPIRTRPADEKRFTCLVSRSHLRGEDQQVKAKFPDACVQYVGSSLKYTQIASGDADITLRRSPTSLWDTAAAQCLVETAGGKMIDFTGHPLGYRTGSLLNPPFVTLGDVNFPWLEFLSQLTN